MCRYGSLININPFSSYDCTDRKLDENDNFFWRMEFSTQLTQQRFERIPVNTRLKDSFRLRVKIILIIMQRYSMILFSLSIRKVKASFHVQKYHC